MSNEPVSVNDASSGKQKPSKGQKASGVILAGILVALPLAYLVFHKVLPVSGSQAMAPEKAAPNIPALEALVRSNPSSANRIDLSFAYINGNSPARAVPVLQALVAAEPTNVIGWNNLCVAHTMEQDYKPALEECQHALQLQPDFQLAKNNYKWARDENNKALHSIATTEALPASQRDAKSYLTEGLDYLHVGDYGSSIAAWNRVLALDPRNAIAANNIGTSYMFLQQPSTALQWFQKAAALDPSFQLAQNNIAWAKSDMAKTK